MCGSMVDIQSLRKKKIGTTTASNKWSALLGGHNNSNNILCDSSFHYTESSCDAVCLFSRASFCLVVVASQSPPFAEHPEGVTCDEE